MNDHSIRRFRGAFLGAAVAAVGLGLALPTFGQNGPDGPGAGSALPTPEQALTADQIRSMMAARRGGSSSSSAASLPSMDSVVDGLRRVSNEEGELFEVYYASDPAAKDPSEIYAVIPPSLVGDDLLLATSVNAGPNAGFQWSDYLVRFERRGQNLVLMVPDLSNRGSGPVRESVERTYRPSILAILPIRAQGPGGSLVVDLKPLTIGGAIPAPGLRGNANPTLSRHTKVKVFPQNVLIDAELVAGGRGGSTASGLSYSFRKLPSLRNPRDRYWPRVEDERVGYFLTVAQDWGKPTDAKETTVRYINRWRVEKLDPRLEMSPPKEPIVFYIEKTVPVQWRRYVRDGIDEWNKAFEKVGIVDAIEVRQQTETQYADIDPEDARYNFLRWIVTGRAFAMGPSRVDPRTGQILDADIIFDDSMLRFFQTDLDLLGPVELARQLGPDTLEFWREHPGFRPMGMSAHDVETALVEMETQKTGFTAAGSNFGLDKDPHAHLETRRAIADLAGAAGIPPVSASKLNPHAGDCNHAVGARQQMAMAHLAYLAAMAPTTQPSTRPADATDAADEGESAVEEEAVAQKIELPEKFLGLILKEVVAHEVGHTLGLRHNFKASAWLSMDEMLEARKSGDKPLVSSVMDYNPVLIFAGDDPEEIATFKTPVIGPYDKWAVEYGYVQVPRAAERARLARIAGRAGEKALAYATDEDTSGLISPDPFVNRYDMSDDPIAWAQSRIDLANELMAGVEDWAVEAGDRNDQLRRAYLNLFFEKVGGINYVARMIGGQRFNRARFSDTITDGDPAGLTPLTAEEQRRALAFLSDTVLADGFFELDAELLNKIVPSRSPGVRGWPGSRIDLPVHQTILNAQNRALSPLCNPTILQRVYDNQLRTTGDDKFTAAELISGTADAVWGDLQVEGEFDENSPMLDSIRRNLQTQHLNYLIAMVDSEPGRLMSADLQNLVRHQLRRLSDRIEDALIDEADLDLGTAAHLSESMARIDRVLNAPHLDARQAANGPIIMMMSQPADE
jgi:hypothetical protein